ncbi:MAG TPA: hypothetical protein VFM48_10390 [Aquabacterium sp.]|nr:hypothetical protein [Aquabacterium sp.]
MFKPKIRHVPLAVAAMVACVNAQAGYQSPDGNFMLSGFGTLGVAKSSTKEAYFNYPGQGTGVQKDFGITPDSKIAVQGTYKLTPEVSATAQVMTKTNGYGDYQPTLEWAFAKWQVVPSVAVRVGRMGAPYFAISDFRDVGYANTWVRPPLDVYGQVPVSQVEGFDISHQMTLGPVTLTSTVWGGNSYAQFAVKKYNPADPTTEPSDVDIKRQLGINFNADIDGGWTLRFGRVQGKLTVASNGGHMLVDGLTATANTYAAFPVVHDPAAAGALMFGDAAANKRASFTGVAATYDPGPYVINLEYTKRKTDSFVSDTTGWYASFGYRVQKFTPFIGVSQIKTNRRDANPLDAWPDFVKATPDAQAAIEGANAILATQKLDDKTLSLGSRWDISNSLALKFQYDQIFKPKDSAGVLASGTPSFVAESQKIRVLSFSADFVF